MRHPGLALLLVAGLAAALPAAAGHGEDMPMRVATNSSRAEVNLPDGRRVAVVGGGGGAQSVVRVNDRLRIIAGGVVIELSGEALSVDGASMAMPAFERLLEIHIDNGKVTLVADP